MRHIYSFIWLLALPWVVLRLLWRARREPGYAHAIGQRLGIFPRVDARPTIWVHAVSVGETRAAQPLIARLRDRMPQVRILLTQTTATGRATALSIYGSDVTLAWLPWDLPWAQRAFLRCWQPAVGILMETELWPNLIAASAEAGVPTLLANARLSERSARRYARLPLLVRPMLDHLHAVAAQTVEDASRLRTLGAHNVVVTGNLKFDVAVPEAQCRLGMEWRAALGARRVVLIASSREGEEAMLLPELDAALPPDVLIAVVPRHPQRFEDVAAFVAAGALSMARRRSDPVPSPAVRVWLGDSMGEMFAWYSLADIAVMGGSWRPLGGQNLIEACAVGCPVVVGPHTFNFAQATEDAIHAGAAVRAADLSDMARRVAALLAQPGERIRMGAAGREFTRAHQGATERCMALIAPLVETLEAARVSAAAPPER